MTKDSECHHPQLRAGLDPKHHWAQLVLPPCYIALSQYPWLCHLWFFESHLVALLALLFRNYSWHTQATIWDASNQIWVGRVQGKLPTVLSLQPCHIFHGATWEETKSPTYSHSPSDWGTNGRMWKWQFVHLCPELTAKHWFHLENTGLWCSNETSISGSQSGLCHSKSNISREMFYSFPKVLKKKKAGPAL